MQPHTNGFNTVDAALSDVARIYRSITGHDLPRNDQPVAPIPPEQDPQRVAEEALARLAALLARQAASGQPAPSMSPPVDCWETAEELVILVDLPGIDRASLQVKVEGGHLVVRAERERLVPDGARPAAVERSPLAFERHIALPPGRRAEPLDAELRAGVLRVRLSRKSGETTSCSVTVR